jgi:gliding motility-associated lipoprotein GldD
MKMLRVLVIILVFGSLTCKNETTYSPKPRMYPKLIFPHQTYQEFDQDCNFTFMFGSHYIVRPYSKQRTDSVTYPCWFDLHSDTLNATIHLSYMSIKSKQDFDDHLKDAFRMADEHNIKASFRNESIIDDSKRSMHGLIFTLEGNVASPYQFYLTDSTRHFLRGSLYFNSVVNQDSTRVIYDFIVKDLQKTIETIKWK